MLVEIKLTPDYNWRREVVYMVLAGIFLGTLAMLNVLGVSKFIDLSFTIFGRKIPFVIAVGVLAYPITFLCTDFISELFGRRRANLVVWIGLVLNIWVLFIIWLGGVLPPDMPQEIIDSTTGQMNSGMAFYQMRSYVFGATLASMVAYLSAQFCDVHVFHFFKKLTKGKHLWLRNNASTMTSQMIDSVAVILITHYYTNALPINPEESLQSQLAMYILSSYLFKFLAALLDTIPFYYGVKLLSKYLNINNEIVSE